MELIPKDPPDVKQFDCVMTEGTIVDLNIDRIAQQEADLGNWELMIL